MIVRIRWQSLVLVAAFLSIALMLPSPLRAEEHAPQAGDHAQAVHGEREHGEAQTPNLFGGDLGNMFWTATIFIVLLIVLRATAWKPILTALQNRERFITDSLSDAKRDRDEAKRLMAEYAAKIEQARVEATAIVEDGRRDGEALRRKLHEETNKEVQEMIGRAQRDIKMAQEAAIADLYTRTLELATGVAGKIIRKQLSPTDHRALLDESVAELSKASKN